MAEANITTKSSWAMFLESTRSARRPDDKRWPASGAVPAPSHEFEGVSLPEYALVGDGKRRLVSLGIG
jgi:hypothetical protein